jgi:transcriptional regulator with XRE-family HTH domain
MSPYVEESLMTVISEERSPDYRTDVINAAMGAQRLTNEALAQKAGVSAKTVSWVRNGDPNVGLPTLKSIATALGLELHQLFEPKAA